MNCFWGPTLKQLESYWCSQIGHVLSELFWNYSEAFALDRRVWSCSFPFYHPRLSKSEREAAVLSLSEIDHLIGYNLFTGFLFDTVQNKYCWTKSESIVKQKKKTAGGRGVGSVNTPVKTVSSPLNTYFNRLALLSWESNWRNGNRWINLY